MVRCGSYLLVGCGLSPVLAVHFFRVWGWLLVAWMVGTVSLMWVLVLIKGVVVLWWRVVRKGWWTQRTKRTVSWASVVLVLRGSGLCNW